LSLIPGHGRSNGSPAENGAPRHEAHSSRLYAEFSHFYDIFFGRVFLPRVSRVIRSLGIRPGARVLELGVGTGAALSAYPTHCRVTGLDMSADMLREARHRIERRGWKHIDVVQGDATDLEFPDDSFDYVMAFHVVTVVTEPERLMQEAVRVCKPEGRVVVVNRFRSSMPLLAKVEKGLEPVTSRWGWRTLSRHEVFAPQPLEIVGSRRGGPWGIFTAVVARNVKNGSPATRGGNGTDS
jgi:phosphatidylethanolamine/phosphatidyl-N-methylethanolamine N-methyltransferase